MDIDINLSDIKDKSPFGQPPLKKNKNRRFNLPEIGRAHV